MVSFLQGRTLRLRGPTNPESDSHQTGGAGVGICICLTLRVLLSAACLSGGAELPSAKYKFWSPLPFCRAWNSYLHLLLLTGDLGTSSDCHYLLVEVGNTQKLLEYGYFRWLRMGPPVLSWKMPSWPLVFKIYAEFLIICKLHLEFAYKFPVNVIINKTYLGTPAVCI